jgi:hypothetical protein
MMLPWWVWSLIAIALVGILGYRQVDLSAKVMVVLVGLEYLIVLIVDFAILGGKGGAEGTGLSVNIFDFGADLGLADRGDPVLPGLVHRDRGDDDLRRRSPRPRKDHPARDLSVDPDDRRVLRLHHLADDRGHRSRQADRNHRRRRCRTDARPRSTSSCWPKPTPTRPSR